MFFYYNMSLVVLQGVPDPFKTKNPNGGGIGFGGTKNAGHGNWKCIVNPSKKLQGNGSLRNVDYKNYGGPTGFFKIPNPPKLKKKKTDKKTLLLPVTLQDRTIVNENNNFRSFNNGATPGTFVSPLSLGDTSTTTQEVSAVAQQLASDGRRNNFSNVLNRAYNAVADIFGMAGSNRGPQRYVATDIDNLPLVMTGENIGFTLEESESVYGTPRSSVYTTPQGSTLEESESVYGTPRSSVYTTPQGSGYSTPISSVSTPVSSVSTSANQVEQAVEQMRAWIENNDSGTARSRRPSNEQIRNFVLERANSEQEPATPAYTPPPDYENDEVLPGYSPPGPNYVQRPLGVEVEDMIQAGLQQQQQQQQQQQPEQPAPILLREFARVFEERRRELPSPPRLENNVGSPPAEIISTTVPDYRPDEILRPAVQGRGIAEPAIPTPISEEVVNRGYGLQGEDEYAIDSPPEVVSARSANNRNIRKRAVVSDTSTSLVRKKKKKKSVPQPSSSRPSRSRPAPGTYKEISSSSSSSDYTPEVIRKAKAKGKSPAQPVPQPSSSRTQRVRPAAGTYKERKNSSSSSSSLSSAASSDYTPEAIRRKNKGKGRASSKKKNS